MAPQRRATPIAPAPRISQAGISFPSNAASVTGKMVNKTPAHLAAQECAPFCTTGQRSGLNPTAIQAECEVKNIRNGRSQVLDRDAHWHNAFNYKLQQLQDAHAALSAQVVELVAEVRRAKLIATETESIVRGLESVNERLLQRALLFSRDSLKKTHREFCALTYCRSKFCSPGVPRAEDYSLYIGRVLAYGVLFFAK